MELILKKMLIMDSEELPMIIPPLKWERDSKGNIVQYGGVMITYRRK